MLVFWCNIVVAQDGVVVKRFMSEENFTWLFKKGDSIPFLHDRWCTSNPYCTIFARQYRVSTNKRAINYVVRESFEQSLWPYYFQRELHGFEHQQLCDLKALMLPTQLLMGTNDKLARCHDVTSKLSVKLLTSLMSSLDITVTTLDKFSIWKIDVPAKF
ncbi:hypothetical protein V6N13_041531 [Hibiscus sabdariffa]